MHAKYAFHYSRLLKKTCIHCTIHTINLCLDGLLQKKSVLLRVRLLHVALGHLLHHEIAVNLDIFDEHTILNTPFSCDGKDTDRRFGIDERVDTCGDIRERKFVGCLWNESVLIRVRSGVIQNEIELSTKNAVYWVQSYLTDGLLVRDRVGGLRVDIARLEFV